MAAIATPNFMSTRGRILVASADAAFRRRVMKHRDLVGSTSEEAEGGAHALAKLLHLPCESVLLDRNLPDLDAAEVASFIRKTYPRTSVHLVDSRAVNAEPQDVEIRGEESASHEVLPFPAGPERQAERRSSESVSAENLPGMIGGSRTIQQVYRLARMVAARDTSVLITGETGTGKELVAQALHQLSCRARQPFVVVNCAAIPESLLESELFGHVRGAFTGAMQSRLGRIHVAQGGTLFLDEIGELPLNMQAKLLRFLQNGEVQRLGSSEVYRVDVRVICATNARLLDLVQAKQFRQDLYYRLAIFPIAVPPLRERLEDIGQLVAHFLERLSEENDMPLKQLSAAALTLLQQSEWTGNVRELQHAIERAFILAGNGTQLHAEHFQAFNESGSFREI